MNMTSTALRSAFARRLSTLYGTEVPAYATLVDESEAVNRDVMETEGAHAARLGSIARVTAERHGAIRVGSPRELAQVATIFGAMGMHSVGFYDLRETLSSSLPIVSTAFRPIDSEELAANPFRVFTSMLVPSDRRFFTEDLGMRLENYLANRTLFPPELLDLARRAEIEGELPNDTAQQFLDLATNSFALSTEPVDKAWYRELEAVSAVAADIGGVSSTHINHLTPRVLDIDSLHSRMEQRGVAMIDTIQGPPRINAPDILLRQTSFRALDEQREFREADGSVSIGTLRVRFGEVESRGIAVTPAGRELYDRFLEATDGSTEPGHTPTDRNDAARARWAEMMPRSEQELIRNQLAYFTFSMQSPELAGEATTILDLVESGAVSAEPIVYEDFLPKSAAGIFRSNLQSEGFRHHLEAESGIDANWLASVIDRPMHDPYELYAQMQRASIDRISSELKRALEPLGE